ncbi:maleylacetoacetate isomerase [Thalassotalea sp. ND16A]|uniref:maleylacetoacetate isomerase n=1 Tax=Thalassotalea sp. ND16A TaxID=1535422 RepID=UPI00051A662F|nr:maleylacetoacetate isomerase [Thalassotalea sp. ND16A]KGK00941.1 Maleylacetoacetate isomerase [Thalassotalea sp. ND16A]
MIKLYGYWRSSAAYRVRIALNLKQIEHELISVHLVKDGGQQHSKDYIELNPNHLVPTLVDGEFSLNQSLAIIDYLEDLDNSVALYPQNIKDKALVKAFAYDLAMDIHPLNNLRVLQYLSKQLNVTDDQKTAWYHHWIEQGFTAIEKRLVSSAGKYCFGNQLTIADLCLIPQIYNAQRFNVNMQAFPLINSIHENCNKLHAFIEALPENQDDAS